MPVAQSLRAARTGTGNRTGKSPLEASTMTIHLGLTPLISLIAGILILVFPRLLNYIVGLYLIIVGLIGIFGAGNFHF
jgi:drug/metabolite transporter (DMT)-like permease